MHFISGLPRSGSTLLAALLRQNPAFHASFQSPLGQMFVTLHEQMSHRTNEAACLMTDEQRMRCLRWLFSAYYADAFADPIVEVFDTNRRWCAYISTLSVLFPTCKVIACVRSPRAIVDSLERLIRAHPLEISHIIRVPNTTVYERLPIYLQAPGIFGYAFNALRDAYYGPDKERLIIVNYDNLAQRPLLTLEQLHAQLGIPSFAYDIENVETPPGADAFDRSLGLPGLHAVKPQVTFEPRKSILPPDIVARIPVPFW